MPDPAPEGTGGGVPRALELLAAWSWRLLVVGAAGLAVLWVVGRAWVAVLPLVVALFLSRVLVVPYAALCRRGWRSGIAAAVTVLGLVVTLAGIGAIVGFSVAQEADDIGSAVSEALDDLEDWLVEDSPFDVERSDVDELRADVGDSISDAASSSGDSIASGTVLALEVLASVVLGLVITFFALKDGDRFLRWVHSVVPGPHRAHVERAAQRSWATLGGYLRGAALLGALEGAVIGTTMALAGASLALVVGVVTFLAAFVPVLGAVVAGGLAVLVTLATAGWAPALVVLVVAVVVQQLDNDLLAPYIYGRALEIHPVVILVTITAGGALFGIAGTFLAVPTVAVASNIVEELYLVPRKDAAATQGVDDAGGPS